MSSLEPANNDFESYTRVNKNQNINLIKIPKSPLMLKHSTLNSKNNEANLSNDLNSKILDKLSKSSIENPANIPILCTESFNANDPKWVQLTNKFNLCGLNVRLIELQKGVPVNSIFYLSNLDLVYVKTADDLEGYVPRNCCRPIISGNELSMQKSQPKPKTLVGFRPVKSIGSDTDTLNTNSNNYSDEKSAANDSIKYHSLSIESEYDDLVELKEENLPRPKSAKNNYLAGYENNHTQFSVLNPDYSICKYRDSGYRSEIENNMTNFSSNYKILDESQDRVDKSSKCLISMQSRSRLPISIQNNLNLTLMDDNGLSENHDSFCNFNCKSEFCNKSNLRMSARQPRYKKNEFKRNNIRRSLDSYLTTNQNDSSRIQSFYAVSIDLDENKHKSNELNIDSKDLMYYPDLDLNKIELDSLNELDKEQEKIWTIILKHDARNFQEISVSPGMLVSVIRDFNDMIYVKLLGYENSCLNLSQQYGIIPKSCAVDLQEIICSSNRNLNARIEQNRRKSQITAL